MPTTPIQNPIWAGPSLFVPMHMDALVVGEGNRLSPASWASVAMDYTQLTGGLNPAPAPFQTAAAAPLAGVHLHWSLPAALRHGTQESKSGDVKFPLVPNRWVVARFVYAQPGAAPAITAWVLQSDYVGSQGDGTNAYPGLTNPYQITYLGKQFNLADWDGGVNPVTPFLQAPGPGELSWSAVYSNVENMFAFYDALAGITSGTCSYAVLGWYAKPEDDPLFGAGTGFTDQAEWQQLMDTLQWAVGSPDDLATRIEDAQQAFQNWLGLHPVQGGPPATAAQLQFASQTLCHGLLFGIDWKGPSPAYPVPPILQGTNYPTVAVGANAAEALAAWLGKYLNTQSGFSASDVETLLTAFQLDQVFSYVQDPAGFAVNAHAARFNTFPGGQTWIVNRQQDTKQEGTGGVQEIALTGAQTQKLITLNSQQLAVDEAQQVLDSRRWELFAAGWKLQHLDPFAGDLQKQVQAYIDQLTASIPTLETALARAKADRDQTQKEMTALLSADGATQFVLTTIDAPRFRQPADPVVLVEGISTDTKYDPPDEQLFTRFTGQTVAGLHVEFGSIASSLPSVNVTAADLVAQVKWPSYTAVPKELQDFWLECLLLDTSASTWLASLAFQKAGLANPTAAQLQALATQIAKQQTLVWNADAAVIDQRTVAEAAGLLPVTTGEPVCVPDKSAVSLWAPPWTPLYLDWEITWYPSAASPSGMLPPWSLGEFDYQWNRTAVAPAAGTIQGRTLLASQLAEGLGQKINEFLTKMSGVLSDKLPAYQLKELQAAASDLQQADVMMQSITGFAQRMIMRQVYSSLPQPGGVADDLIEGVMTWVPAPNESDSAGFFPIRAGHFEFKRLQIVDAFGQILAGSPGAGAVIPILSQSLTPTNPVRSSLIQLTPRLSQPCRLDFRFLSASDDTIRTNSSDRTSPICGWLLPNHLDESLMVFDAQGGSLGAVIKIERDVEDMPDMDGALPDSVNTGLRWEAAPGTEAPLGGPPRIANPHLLGFVTALLKRGLEGSDALDELLDLIDVTLWATDPLGEPRKGTLSVLVGRPIAVVRAGISLELDGGPVYDQTWDQTGKQVTNGFTSVTFPMRMGDFAIAGNGLLGYFDSDNYDQCNSMYGFQPAMGAVRRAFSPRVPDPRAALARIDLNGQTLNRKNSGYVVNGYTFAVPGDETVTRLVTCLVDPRGTIPLISGILPVETLVLPNGPVDSALNAMAASFRMGPLLLEPGRFSAPVPADTGGKWSWIERTGVTFWREDPVASSQRAPGLPVVPPTIREGWLRLGGALGSQKEMGK